MPLQIGRRDLRVPFTVLREEQGATLFCGAPLGNARLAATLRHRGRVIDRQVVSESRPSIHWPQLQAGEDYDVVVRPDRWQQSLAVRPAKLGIRWAAPRRLRALVVGSGRCGTTSLAHFLDGARFADGEAVCARHETLAYPLLRSILHRDGDTPRRIMRSLPHNVEVATGYMALIPQAIDADRVVLLVRDGRDVVSSGMARGWFRRDSVWDKVKPDFPGSVFEKCCHLWTEANQILLARSEAVFRLEDLGSSTEEQARLLGVLGIAPSGREMERLNAGHATAGVRSWSAENHAIFARVCGPLMDRLYPGWRDPAGSA